MYDEKSVAEFLSRFKPERHRRMLETFRNAFLEYRGTYNTTEDPDELLRTIHSVKSAAFTIEANALGECAKELENRLVDDAEDNLEDDLAVLNTRIYDVICVLESQIEKCAA